MIALDDFERVKREVEQMRQDKARAEGALAQLSQRAKEVLGVKTLKEAKAKLLELEEEERKAAAEFESALAEYRQATKGKLDSTD